MTHRSEQSHCRSPDQPPGRTLAGISLQSQLGNYTVFKPPGTKLFKMCHCAGFEAKATPQKEARVNSSSIINNTDEEGDAALKVREIITWLMRQHGWQEMPSILPQGLMQKDMFIDWAFSTTASSSSIIYVSALRLMERSWGTLECFGFFLLFLLFKWKHDF